MKHKTAVVVSMLLTWLLSACIVVVILMAPTYLQKAHGIPASLALQANCLATITLMIGCVTVGMIVDRIGAGKTFIFGSILLAAGCAFFYLVAARDPSLLFLGYAVAGLCVCVVGAVPYVMVQAFPPEVRFSGISFSYNVSYAIFGGLTPISVTLMMQITPIAPAVYVLALSGLGLLLGLYLYQTQSRRRVALTESAQSL